MKNFFSPLRCLGMGCGTILLAVLMYFLIAWGIRLYKDMTAEPPQERATVISMEDLHRAYAKDPIAADKKYKGKQLLITGKIENIHEWPDGKTVSIGLYTGNRVPATARFEGQKAKLKSLKIGESIAFKCEIEKFDKVSSANLHQYVPGASAITKYVPNIVLNILPEISLVEIVHLQNCELVEL